MENKSSENKSNYKNWGRKSEKERKRKKKKEKKKRRKKKEKRKYLNNQFKIKCVIDEKKYSQSWLFWEDKGV